MNTYPDHLDLGMRPSGAPQTAILDPTQNENNSQPSKHQGGPLNRLNIPGKNNTSRKGVNHKDARPPTPALPPAPKNCFFREKILNKILDRTDQVTSVALLGPIGVGKSSIALTLLHHNRTKAKFGQRCYFMRCDDLTNSLGSFLERLSAIFHTDKRQLHAHLRSSPPFILLLDGVDFILDPLAPDSQGISATIQAFSGYESACLITTSRLNPKINGFHPVEVPTLPADGARDTFYSLCNLSKSSAVDSFIEALDFHPLSIELLASLVRENRWDEPTLLKTWKLYQGALRKSHYERLKDTIEPALRSPTIQRLGTAARGVLEEIAAVPHGIKEYELEREMPGTGEVADALCNFYLVYRQDGFVKMLFPLRAYFMELALAFPQPAMNKGLTVKPCMSFPFQLFRSCSVTPFNGFLQTHLDPRVVVRLTLPRTLSTVMPTTRLGEHVRLSHLVYFVVVGLTTFQRATRSLP